MPSSVVEECTVSQMDADRNSRIRRLLDHLRAGTTDEVDAIAPFEAREYVDPDVARRERELVFGRVPSIVAHGSELPEPNDFITLQMPRNRVIVVRQPDRTVKAFVNACRHRGALLEEKEAGRCRLFSCPYHRWSYDLDGSLRTVTRDSTFGEVDRSQHGLIELPAEERHGFVWMVDNKDGQIDVADWLGPQMDEILGCYDLDRYQCVHSGVYEQPVNWKVLQDAFLDGYHIQYAHPNSAAKHIHTNVQVVEDFGRHCRFISPRKSIDRWLEEDPGDQDLSVHTTEAHFLGPNCTLLRQPDHFELLTFRPHPSDPGQGRMEMRVIAPRLEDTDLDEATWTRRWAKNWQILMDVLQDEDLPILRGSQIALSSADTGGMLLGRNEVLNHVFRRELRKLLAGDAEAAPADGAAVRLTG